MTRSSGNSGDLRPTHGKDARRVVTGWAAVALAGAVLAIALAGATPAVAGPAFPWTATEAPVPSGAASSAFAYPATFIQEQCISDSTCIAVGSYKDTSGETWGLIETLSGGTWSATAAPEPVDADSSNFAGLNSVSCTSATACTAVGYYTNDLGYSAALVVTLSGTTWTAAAAPQPSGSDDDNTKLSSVSCTAATACTAVGADATSATSSDGFTDTLSGATWTAAQVGLPSNAATTNPTGSLVQVSCTSDTTCTAVGSYKDSSGYTAPLIDTLSSSWAAVEAPLPGDSGTDGDGQLNATLASVSCTVSTACTAVGSYNDSSTDNSRGGYAWGLIDSLSGTTWSAVSAPEPGTAGTDTAGNQGAHLVSVSCSSATWCAAVGGFQDSGVAGGFAYGLIDTGSGTSWSADAAPQPSGAGTDMDGEELSGLVSVSCDSDTYCAAAGSYHDTNGHHPGYLIDLESGTPTATEAPTPSNASTTTYSPLSTISCTDENYCGAGGTYGDTGGNIQGLLELGETTEGAPGPATQLVFSTEPAGATVGGAFTTQPVVTVEDASGDVVTTDSSTVSLSIASGTPTSGGPGALSGCSQNESSGVITFSGCQIGTLGTAYELHATDGSLTAATSAAFNVTAGTASKLVFSTQPAGASAGSAFGTEPVVTVEDASGDVVTTDSSTVSLSIALGTPTSGGPGALSGCSQNESSGVITFSGCQIGTLGTAYELHATDGSLTAATSAAFNVTAGTASKLVFSTEPPSSTATGSAFTSVVSEEDTNGNVISSDSATTVTLSIAANPAAGTLTCTNPGGATPTVSSGVASFTCSINKAGSGYTLAAASGSLTSALSTSFTITGTSTLPPPAPAPTTPTTATTTAATTATTTTSQTGNPTTPVVTIASARSVTSTSAVLSGTVNPKGSATSSHFQYGTTTAYGHTTADASEGAGTAALAVSVPVTGLSPATMYHVQLVATSATGTTKSTDVSFTTLASCVARTSNAEFVCAAYEALLGRAPDNAGVALYTGLLASGTSRAAVATDILTSSAYRRALVQSDYQAYLGRAADNEGVSYRLAQLAGGATDEELQANIVGSAEFFTRAGGTNAAFVTALYHDLLNRAPSSSELSSAERALVTAETPSRVQQVTTVLTDHAYRAALVQSFYEAYLGRSADASGVSYWVGLLAGGATDEKLQADILSSAEFFTHAGGTNAGFVTAVYHDLLNRVPSASERAHWVAALASGTSRAAAATDILTSSAYRTALVQSDYQAYLDRNADATGVSYWVGQLAGGATDEELQASIGGSAEFFSRAGGTNAGFVTALYHDLLNRAPSGSELSSAESALVAAETLSRVQQVTTVLTDHAYRAALVQSFYEAYLGRSADASGVSYWVGLLAGGATDEELQASIVGSAEFFSLHG
jgi:hypothetical protein